MNSADLVARLRADDLLYNRGPDYEPIPIPASDLRKEAADRIEVLEAWKAEAMEVLRAVAEDGELFGHPDKYQIAARRLVEKEDGR